MGKIADDIRRYKSRQLSFMTRDLSRLVKEAIDCLTQPFIKKKEDIENL
jgi:hypothetical protein